MTAISIQVDIGPDSDAHEVDELTSKLRHQLLQLDVAAVERPTLGPAPPDTRGVDAASVGALIVQVGTGAAAILPVIKTVQNWLSGSKNRRVKLQIAGDTLEVTGLSSDEQERLISVWIAQHTNS